MGVCSNGVRHSVNEPVVKPIERLQTIERTRRDQRVGPWRLRLARRLRSLSIQRIVLALVADDSLADLAGQVACWQQQKQHALTSCQGLC
jgi:hypothetical protein